MEYQHPDQPSETSGATAVPPPEPPASTDDGASVDEELAPFLHDAETVQIELAPYSLTREQVAERYAAAGFKVMPRTVSLYAQQGRLRARKVGAKNGLERYLFDATSVDQDITERRRQAESYAAPETVYAAPIKTPDGHHSGADAAIAMHAPSKHPNVRATEIRVAVLETELRMERDARTRAERRADQEANRSLALAQQIGEYRHRVAMLEAPKEESPPEPAPESAPGPEDPKPRASFMRRFFGGK